MSVAAQTTRRRPRVSFDPIQQLRAHEYVAGRSLGVQFHPEVTPQIMEDWVRVYGHELDADGVDPDALLQETYDRAESARASSRRLLDTYLERVAKLGDRR